MNTKVYYCITDSGDGSASLRLFETQEALDLYLDHINEQGYTYDLSEGGGFLEFDGTVLSRDGYNNVMTLQEVQDLINE